MNETYKANRKAEIATKVKDYLVGVKSVEVGQMYNMPESARVTVTFKSGETVNGMYFAPGDEFPFMDVVLED